MSSSDEDSEHVMDIGEHYASNYRSATHMQGACVCWLMYSNGLLHISLLTFMCMARINFANASLCTYGIGQLFTAHDIYVVNFAACDSDEGVIVRKRKRKEKVFFIQYSSDEADACSKLMHNDMPTLMHGKPGLVH